jgi:hypothetical protein
MLMLMQVLPKMQMQAQHANFAIVIFVLKMK